MEQSIQTRRIFKVCKSNRCSVFVLSRTTTRKVLTATNRVANHAPVYANPIALVLCHATQTNIMRRDKTSSDGFLSPPLSLLSNWCRLFGLSLRRAIKSRRTKQFSPPALVRLVFCLLNGAKGKPNKWPAHWRIYQICETQ